MIKNIIILFYCVLLIVENNKFFGRYCIWREIAGRLSVKLFGQLIHLYPWQKVVFLLNHNDVIKKQTFYICRNYKGIASSGFSPLSLLIWLSSPFLQLRKKYANHLPFGFMEVKFFCQTTTAFCETSLSTWLLTCNQCHHTSRKVFLPISFF